MICAHLCTRVVAIVKSSRAVLIGSPGTQPGTLDPTRLHGMGSTPTCQLTQKLLFELVW